MHRWIERHPRTVAYIAVMVTLTFIIQVYTLIRLGVLTP